MEAPDSLTIRGNMGWAKQKKMTPIRMILLRGFMLTIGRHYPDLVRKILQKVLITGKSTAPFRFHRTLRVNETGCLEVEDRVEAGDWNIVEEAAIGVDQTSIYVIMSRVFQPAQMLPWQDLTPLLNSLPNNTTLEITRHFPS
jgi:hypothetical protein